MKYLLDSSAGIANCN